MAAITITATLGDDDPPVGVIDMGDTFQAVIPLDDTIVFIAVDASLKPHLVETLRQLADACDESVGAT